MYVPVVPYKKDTYPKILEALELCNEQGLTEKKDLGVYTLNNF